MKHVIHFQMKNCGKASNFMYFQDKTSQLFTFKKHFTVKFNFIKIKGLKIILFSQVFLKIFSPSSITQSASKKKKTCFRLIHFS